MTEAEEKDKIYLLDSNIWLYAFIKTQDADKSKIAKSLIQQKDSAIVISTQIINEVCVNLIRKAHFSEEKIRELIKSFYGKYEVVGIDNEILLRASEIRESHSYSFWDSLILASALYADADILYSEDMQDGFVLEENTTVNPFK
ncbi:PIN domain-containing protein [Candidatus Electrothrix sp.]|uniref:PIN domain-containing protein n=3 Tax=Candidatus Electrothrix sp. TaxID=2170559 RepID=UPI0040576B85